MEKLREHRSHDRKVSRRSNRRSIGRYNRLALVSQKHLTFPFLSPFTFSPQIHSKLTNPRSFLGQCPPTIIALLLVIWKLHTPHPQATQSKEKATHLSKLRRIDFLGAILMSVSIVCFLMVLDMGGQNMIWTSPKILTLFGTSLIAGNLFLLVEQFWAKEPIFPLHLLRNRDVVTSFVNLAFQTGAQGAVSNFILIGMTELMRCIDDASCAYVLPSLGSRFGGKRRCTSNAIRHWKCPWWSPFRLRDQTVRSPPSYF